MQKKLFAVYKDNILAFNFIERSGDAGALLFENFWFMANNQIMRIVANFLYNEIQSKKMSCHSIVGDVENGLFFLNKWNFIDEIAVYDISTRKDELFINRKNVEVLKLNHKPISYGGQISSLEDVKRAIAIGFDKVIINSNKYDLNF